MPWIKSDSSLRNHPKMRRFARTLDICPFKAIGHLHCLWWWVMEYAPDGDLSKYEPADIADAAGWEGDPEQFVQALVLCGPGESCGFVDSDMRVHDWQEYGGALHKKRQSNAKRQQRFRDRKQEKKGVTRDEAVTSHQNNGPEERRVEKRRVEESREEEKHRTGNKNAGKNTLPASSPANAAESPPEKGKNVPYKKIVNLYHELCPSLPRVETLRENRKALIRARWKENPSLEWWERYFGRIERCDFLAGRVEAGPGRNKPFLADLEWIVRPSNMDKILEGKYDNRDGSGEDPWLKRCLDFARNQQPETIDAEVVPRD